MSDEKIGEVLVKDITLTGIVKWLNDSDFKKEGSRIKNPEFTVSDVQQYISVEHIPTYMGNISITKSDNKYAKLYSIIDNN